VAMELVPSRTIFQNSGSINSSLFLINRLRRMAVAGVRDWRTFSVKIDCLQARESTPLSNKSATILLSVNLRDPAVISALYFILLIRQLNQNPIFIIKKWGLIGLLHGPAFRLEVAGIYKARIITVNINHNKELKSNPKFRNIKRYWSENYKNLCQIFLKSLKILS